MVCGVCFPGILNTIANDDLGCTADRAPIQFYIKARRWQSSTINLGIFTTQPVARRINVFSASMGVLLCVEVDLSAFSCSYEHSTT